MFNPKILSPEAQQYIVENKDADLTRLLLKKTPFPEITIQELAQQIKGRKTAEKKFPGMLWPGVVFPATINLEQTSSEATAIYKQQFARGKTFVDLTTGFGVDAFYLSEKFEETTLLEQNPALLEMVRHNWALHGKNAEFICDTTEEFLNTSRKFDFLFLDPARRSSSQKKVFLLEDLSPNLLEIWDAVLNAGERILIKLSPLIDITYLINTLPFIHEIHAVAVRNELKEILVLISGQKVSDIKIVAANLQSPEPIFSYSFNETAHTAVEFAAPSKHLYLPNAAIAKTQAFALLADKYRLKKLHPNTHLFTAAEKILDFPGRVLAIEVLQPGNHLKGKKFNIISKNFPLTPSQIKKKYKLQDGGDEYLIATESVVGKVFLKGKLV